MEYIGEHTWAGELGRIAVITAFASALFATIAYWFSQKEPGTWKTWARSAFWIHALSIFTVVGTLFFMMANHYFEYDYVWKHTSLDLPAKFLFSAFWEGQEGSFLLWMFWHAVLGLVLMYTARNWEGPVLSVFSIVQAFLTTMIMGIYIGSYKLGFSPFILIREMPENIGLPWTQMADYLQRIPGFMDGSGLNPLLQNYWMTIHPPTLFLGFASTLVPFAFAIAALANGDFKSWIKPALPWAFFSVMILGTGILMGGAWAYEALSFGGFWAWDPVENSSLVPWITMVGGAHLILIQRNRGGFLRSAFFFNIISFLLVLYSTFLTRSGILGDSSVHSFVDLGLSGQLVVYLLFFVIAAFGLFIYRYRTIPKPKDDETFDSREFWMFVGQLVFFVSAFQIIFSTSVPVINKLIGPEGWISILEHPMAPPGDPISHYNSLQIPFALILALLIGMTQYMNYRSTKANAFARKIVWSLGFALILTILVSLVFPFGFINSLLLFASIFAIVGNLDFWLRIARGKAAFAGSSVAHIGFGMILLGALISNGQKEVISQNDAYIHKDFPSNENLLIHINDTVEMGPYQVTWTGERQEGTHRIYTMEYLSQNDQGEWIKDFTLEPFINMNERMGNNPEPATRHYWDHDLYTHINWADLRTAEEMDEGWQEIGEFSIGQNDTVIVDQYFAILDSILLDVQEGEDPGHPQMMLIGANLRILSMDGSQYKAVPILAIHQGQTEHFDATIDELGIKFHFEKVDTETNKMVMKFSKRDDEPPFILVKAIIFPQINILWIGSILMAIGTLIAIIQRIRKQKAS
ncbi:MAG: cytochrome c biogenesis protein CcsA [Bacteroidota bacterium]|nr:cytochrome c biogenesis protein CcsA [Bacteroidota bacterium]